MKIALVTHWLSSAGGGVSVVVEALSSELEKQGHDVRVFGLKDDLWATQRNDWSGAPAEVFKPLGPSTLGFAPALLRALEYFSPDIVHTHGIWMMTSMSVSRWNAPSLRRPYVVSPHGMLDPWALSNSRFKKCLGRALFEDRHINGADCLHALNLAEKNAIRKYGFYRTSRNYSQRSINWHLW